MTDCKIRDEWPSEAEERNLKEERLPPTVAQDPGQDTSDHVRISKFHSSAADIGIAHGFSNFSAFFLGESS